MHKRFITFIAPLIALTAMADATPQGALPGLFSISANQKVQFAQGNLQYQASSHTWRFAEHQWDYIGANNANISESYNGWIDLFGWGTSGYHDASDTLNTHYQPWDAALSYNASDDNRTGYGPSYGMHSALYPGLRTAFFANYDWGVYNQISNGGEKGSWRVLTQDEWLYLINSRTNAANLRSMATVEGVYGLVILPDGSSVSVSPSSISTSADLSAAQAVFLPAAGYRGLSTKGATTGSMEIREVGTNANYWSSSATDNNSLNAYSLDASSSDIRMSTYNRFDGFSVRLVYEANPASWITLSDRPTDETAQKSLLTTQKTAAKPINVHLKRTLYSDGWNTLCLPFDLTNAEWKSTFGETAYVAKYGSATLSDDKKELTLNMTVLAADENMTAGTPYIIIPTNDVVNPDFTNRTIAVDAANGETLPTTGDIQFLGIINRTQLTPGDKKYLFVTATDQLDWSKVGDTSKMYGTRAYFYVPGMEEAKALQATARMVVRQAPTIATNIQNTHHTEQIIKKVVFNGQFLIIRDGKTYSVTGQEMEVQL